MNLKAEGSFKERKLGKKTRDERQGTGDWGRETGDEGQGHASRRALGGQETRRNG